ncbi:MAG: hypothetical protein A3F89_01240 [Deltaproteobacteria bacterium RIFCSPLOWO2_12_FULL_50_11]|nr:MAG: hypothetical protein A3B79_01610 [Deltaproteobacteria bacterium RIFCSPHIGHO2_02_FULL_50_15]OGQ68096.1 MAG: hypothetical protein A3F89_01240 [Deltaproteobacteria bacterium RIFCSPLOWO2_12_FULL_50_11]
MKLFQILLTLFVVLATGWVGMVPGQTGDLEAREQVRRPYVQRPARRPQNRVDALSSRPRSQGLKVDTVWERRFDFNGDGYLDRREAEAAYRARLQLNAQ